MLKKSAFTLAEVLMVIGIIGAVSMLTVTNARKGTDTAEKITQLRKTHEILESVVQQAVMEDGQIKNWQYMLTDTKTANAYQSEYVLKHIFNRLKLNKNCETSSGCWASDISGTSLYTTINTKGDKPNSDTASVKGILSNDASVSFYLSKAPTALTADQQTLFGYTGGDIIGYITVDVNGTAKGNTKWGDDVFLFLWTIDDGIVPIGNNVALNGANSCPNKLDICSAWAFYKGNEDYFKTCADKNHNGLAWNDVSKASCK